MEFRNDEKNFYIVGAECFSLAETLDCGQAFRWSEKDGVWQAVVGNKLRRISQEGDTITIFDCDKEEFETFYTPYFDLDRDYGEIVKAVSQNEVFMKAVAVAGGIRILRQDPWETLCSFIISQNNNIPRIKGIIDRLCENFGNKTCGGYTFPSAEKIAALSLEDLSPLRSGFRAKYILDAARKFASGEVSSDRINALSTDEARAELMKIYGVGEKVADCTLLFGFGRIDAFPKDVWIKRAMAVLFDGVLPECAVPFAGIAQQYLFHYARMTKLTF
ncbi:MAG: DNA-3-methyladenine glycosylase 2 family protein [Clostridia bacterium]|nr:DNA-3-methyladenine glycosylase 2 family protein [Clostridia bacterium]